MDMATVGGISLVLAIGIITGFLLHTRPSEWEAPPDETIDELVTQFHALKTMKDEITEQNVIFENVIEELKTRLSDNPPVCISTQMLIDVPLEDEIEDSQLEGLIHDAIAFDERRQAQNIERLRRKTANTMHLRRYNQALNRPEESEE